MDELKMWTAEHEEWCIAVSAGDASRCYQEMAGEPLEWTPGEPAEWVAEPPEKPFRFQNEDGTITTKTNAEWIRERGRGHFASANV
jgi:hypothetical protein